MNLPKLAAGLAILCMLAGPAAAADNLAGDLARCADVSDDHARLVCYDELALQAKEAGGTASPVSRAAPPPAAVQEPPAAPSSMAAAASAQPPAPTPKQKESWFGFDMGGVFGSSSKQQTTAEQFGSESVPAPSPQQSEPEQPRNLDSIAATLTDYSFNAFGRFVVFLNNGQIWRQMQGDTSVARFKKEPADNKVTISRGVMGSYYLRLDNGTGSFSVIRIK